MPTTSQIASIRYQDVIKGYSHVFTVANLVACISALGFYIFGLKLELYLYELILMIVLVWALPAQVAMLTLYFAGAGVIPIVIAASITSIRLMFMAMDVMVKLRDKAHHWFVLYLLGHFITVTVWVEYGRLAKNMDENQQKPGFLFGLGLAQMTSICAVSLLAYILVGNIPIVLEASLVMATPCFFLLALFANAKNYVDIITIILAMALMPVVAQFAPDVDLILAGIIAASLLWLYDENNRKNNRKIDKKNQNKKP